MANTSEHVTERNGNSPFHEVLVNRRNLIYEEIDEMEFNISYLLGENHSEISFTEFNSLVLKLRKLDKQLGKKTAKQSEKYYEKILSIRKILKERSELEREEERKDQIMKAQIDMFKNSTTNSISAKFSRSAVAVCPDDLRLTPFDGKPLNYPQFEILFEEIYEKNENYSEAQLFLIFRNLIGDEGRRIIATLKPDAAGLKIAKRRLANKYQEFVSISYTDY